MGFSLEAVVRHHGRLDVMCCLLDGAPLDGGQVAARTGRPRAAVDYFLAVLDEVGLVCKLGDLSGSEPLYCLSVDDHPTWVREAIEAHRAGGA